jgi:hypothetical protein
MKDDIWKSVINNLPGDDLPENGLSAPDMEKTSRPPRKRIRDGNTKVFVQRLKTIVYIYTDREGKQYGEQSYQNLSTLGEVPFIEAINLFKNDEDTKDK